MFSNCLQIYALHFIFICNDLTKSICDRSGLGYTQNQIYIKQVINMAFFILCQFFYDIWTTLKNQSTTKNWQKMKNLVLFALNSFLHGTSKLRNHDFRYQICHFFFNCNFSIYIVFISNFLLQADFDYWDPFKGECIKILLPTYMIVPVHIYWFYSLLVFSAKSCTSEYLDKLFISINSILLVEQTSAGQTGQWYWVYGVK